MAWVIRWKKVNNGDNIDSLNIIKPSCLKVDSATIFFMSKCIEALILAIIIVREEKIIKILFKSKNWEKKGLNRNNKKIPAVTNVDECTKAETGVGASIAAGSHLEKGIWALFVILAIRINIIIMYSLDHIWKIFHCPIDSINEILKIIMMSPKRLIRAVNMPADKEDEFW